MGTIRGDVLSREAVERAMCRPGAVYEQDRPPCEAMQVATGASIELVDADRGCKGGGSSRRGGGGIILPMIQLPEATRRLVLLPTRCVVERSLDWMARFRRLARDHEQLATTLTACMTSPSASTTKPLPSLSG